MAFIDASERNIGFTFGGGRDPIAQISPGEPVRVRTQDCFAGRVRSVQDLPSQVCEFPFLNPVTGPLYVQGAQPGDTLAVHLIDLDPVGEVGFSATFPHFGALTGTDATAMLHPALEEVVWEYPLDPVARTVRFTARKAAGGAPPYTVDLPMRPMLGTIGVAPAGGETRMSIVPGAHGGNLDTPLIRAGTTVYLPVNVDGALLALGDGHALQGDGELCGVAVEVPMDVTLVVEVVTGISTPWPRLETDQRYGSIGVARPLEDAYRGSHRRLVDDLCAMTGLDPLDALQLVSQVGMARIGNVVDAEYTVVALINRALFDGEQAYQGAHDRLRAVARVS